ncbi:hypothetical protein U9R90_26655 [Streptomyces sp. E11-3]|uniref:hypothetical protein n=1 Tax=Streptomyces sp. E11-3 TaxID=3110112 RepID=UPI0039805F9B
MANFLDTQVDARRMADLLADYDRRLKALERTTQAAHTSIEGGAMEIYDEEGQLRGSVGVQEDGTVAVVAVNAAPPPTPLAPTVEPVLAGLVAGWDGQWADSYTTPSDVSHVQIHVGASADFTPTASTLAATITSPGGAKATLALDGYGPVWVRLVAVNTAALAGPVSAATQGTPRQAVAQDLIEGIITETQLAENAVSRAALQVGAVGHNELAIGTGNLFPDASFEGAFTDRLLAGTSQWTLTDGNGSPRALRTTSPGPDPLSVSLLITELPVSPGDRLFLAFDYRASADWAGDSLRLYLRWQDATGTVLGYGTAIAAPTPGAGWGRISRQVQAPADTVTATVWVQSFQASAGAADFDNAEIRTVIGAGMVLAESIGALEIAAESITGNHMVTKTLTAREVQALSLTGNELAANSITAGKIAAGSVETPHLSVGAVLPEHVAVGAGTNLVPDPGFETAATAQAIVAAGAPWSLVPGNRSGVGIRLDCSAPEPVSFTLPVATVPVLAANQFQIGIDLLVSDDLAAQAVKILARWENTAGTVLGYGVAETRAPEAGVWQRITGQVAAPQGATQAVICLEATEATAGAVVFDNAETVPIFGRVSGGARAELGPQGLRLFDEGGDTAVSLVTGMPQYLTLRSGGQAVATIDTEGNAGFSDLNVAGQLTVGGDPVTALLGQQARGLVAIDYQAGSRRTTSSEYGFVELAFDADPKRMYRIVFDARANPSKAGGEIQLRLRDGGGAAATISSPQLQFSNHHMALGNSLRVRLECIRSGAALGAGLHRLLLTFQNAYGPADQYVDLYGTSSSPGYLYVEDIGAYVPETGRYNTGGGSTEPPVRTYTKTYTASWSGSYAKRSGYNAYYNSACLQGYYSSNNGTQAALVGFPAALASDLSGATIEKAEVYLYFEHWYSASGGKAVIKAHSHASRPAKFSSDSESKTISWSRNQGKWVDITSVFDSTKWRGIALDPNSTSRTYYGRARGAGQTYPPKLRVTYTK